MEKVKDIEKDTSDSSDVQGSRAPVSSRHGSAAYCWSRESRQEDGNGTGVYDDEFRPCHYFDYFFGTSTGGLSAIMLGRMRMTPSAAKDQYDLVCSSVFGYPNRSTIKGLRIPHFKSGTMELALQYVSLQDQSIEIPSGGILDFSTEVKGNIRRGARKIRLWNAKPYMARTAVVAHGGDVKRTDLLFRSYDHPETRKESGVSGPLKPLQASDLPLWKVGRATSAAPKYFTPMKIAEDEVVDGAVGGKNNPVGVAYEEVRHMHRNSMPSLIISIGTGEKAPKSSRLRTSFRNARQVLSYRKSFQDQILDANNVHEEFRNKIDELNSCNERNHGHDITRYYRFNVPERMSGADSDLAKVKPFEWKGEHGVKTVHDIQKSVDKYLRLPETQSQLVACAKLLVESRRCRQKTVRWEQYAIGLSYSCPEKTTNSKCQQLVFNSRQELKAHAIVAHGFVTQVQGVRHRSGKEDFRAHLYTCIWEHCSEECVTFCDSESDLIEHLRNVHNKSDPKIYDRKDFEEWLDTGRENIPSFHQAPQRLDISRHGTGVGS